MLNAFCLGNDDFVFVISISVKCSMLTVVVLAIAAPCQENKLAKREREGETFEAIWRLLNLIPEIAFACSNFWE